MFFRNQMVCQVRANLLDMPAYKFDHETSECKMGNVSATLPLIAKDEPGQLTVWASQNSLPQTKGEAWYQNM